MTGLRYILGGLLVALPAAADIDALLAGMTVEQKIAQMHIMGFPGNEIDDETAALVTELGIGGFILRPEKNYLLPEDLAALARDLQALAVHDGPGAPLFLAANGDTGAAAPIHPVFGGTATPDPVALAASGRVDDATAAYTALGRDMRACGMNLVFAPTFNVLGAPWNAALGLRTFGADPELVATLAVAAVAALGDAGVLACPGHFPGWVRDTEDIAQGAPVMSESGSVLDALGLDHLAPLLGRPGAAIMTSHHIIEAWDPLEAVTFSRRILQLKLREELGFEGLVFSGPMDWHSANLKYTPGTGALIAVEAGCDVIVQLSDSLEGVRTRIAGVEAAVRSGRLPEARLDQSVRRILEAKARLGLMEDPHPAANPRERLAEPGLQAANETAARNGIVVLANNKQVLPLSGEVGRIASINPFSNVTYPGSGEGRIPLGETLAHFLKQRAENVFEVRIGREPTRAQRQMALDEARKAEVVVVGVLFGQASKTLESLVQEIIAAQPQTVVVGLGLPSDLAAYAGAGALVAANGPTALSASAVVEVLFGETAPGGKLPMPVGNAYPLGHQASLP